MELKELIQSKGIKLRHISGLLKLKEGTLTHRLQRNSPFSFAELAILRENKILDLQDLDNLTKDIDIKK